MKTFEKLLLENKAWAETKKKVDPEYFKLLSKDQKSEFLWIGCSDSRVPANEVTNTEPGEIFVHRNIANLVVHTDLNLLSVLQYAVEVLRVKHIIVCGHYDCGGVKAALTQNNFGLINKWLRNIKDTHRLYRKEVDSIQDERQKINRMCELNVIEQIHHLAETSIVQRAWKNENRLTLHGWIFNMESGLIHELTTMEPRTQLDPIYTFEFE